MIDEIEEGYRKVLSQFSFCRDTLRTKTDYETTIEYRLSITTRVVANLLDPSKAYVVVLKHGEVDEDGKELPYGKFIMFLRNGELVIKETRSEKLRHGMSVPLIPTDSDPYPEVPWIGLISD